jgi:FkbM family methyltransferase
MRKALGRMADAVGTRDALAKGRDRLIDLLSGNGSSRVVRRNRKDDRHFKLLLRFGMRTDSNYLDVGANKGQFLARVQELAPEGRHIAYEPLPDLAEELARRFPGIEVRQCALSDHDGESRFVNVLEPGFRGCSGLAQDGLADGSRLRGLRTATITVRTERLDDNLPDGWLPDFVKIDVEGNELAVLRGAAETLRRAQPVVAFEHGYQPEVTDELYALLCDRIGLRLFDMDGNGPLDRTRFVDELRTRWNWIAHP